MSHRGITLLELTLVILVLLALTAVAFVGARVWMHGSERCSCILTLRNIQMATRAYQNMYGYTYGGHPDPENGSRDIAQQLYDKGYIERQLYERATGADHCPSGGGYFRPRPDVFPKPGDLYMNCSLSTEADHHPKSCANW